MEFSQVQKLAKQFGLSGGGDFLLGRQVGGVSRSDRGDCDRQKLRQTFS